MKKTTVFLAALFLLSGSVPAVFGEEININQPPVADISGDSFESVDQDPVLFSGAGSYDPDGDALTYTWDFGDGIVEEGSEVSHSYGTGTYTLTLTVSDGQESAVDTATVSVRANTAPVAVAGADRVAFVNELVSFDGAGSYDAEGEIKLYQWEYGDGAGDLSSRSDAYHRYSVPGTYIVTLTAIDRHYTGATDTLTVEVRPVSDVISITKAEWSRSAKRLTVEAKSSESGATLNVQGYGTMTYDAARDVHVLVISQVSSQPASVTVISSRGGNATAQVVRVK
jgi:PKD repeat protein